MKNTPTLETLPKSQRSRVRAFFAIDTFSKLSRTPRPHVSKRTVVLQASVATWTQHNGVTGTEIAAASLLAALNGGVKVAAVAINKQAVCLTEKVQGPGGQLTERFSKPPSSAVLCCHGN